MGKERLEEIKNHQYDADRSSDEYEYEKINFYNLHATWLIEQAERVQELERKLDRVRFVNDIFLEKEKHQNKRYREAIGFGIEYLKNSDIRQVQLVVTALKSALEGGE